MKLENWSIGYYSHEATLAPELRRAALQGKVYGHPRFVDGENITTTAIKELIDEDKIKTTSGSIYELGKVDPQYEKEYPDARNRLIASFSK